MCLHAVHRKLCTKNIFIPLFFDGFQQFARHFNENCLTISIFYSKSKSEKCRSIDVVFNVRIQTLAPGRPIFIGIQRFAHHFDENCLTTPYNLLKSKSDYRSSNGDDFSVRRWISAPKLSRVDDSSCLFFGGGRILTAFYMTVHQKAL